MSTVEPFVSEADQAEWIEKIKATDKLNRTGFVGDFFI